MHGAGAPRPYNYLSPIMVTQLGFRPTSIAAMTFLLMISTITTDCVSEMTRYRLFSSLSIVMYDALPSTFR